MDTSKTDMCEKCGNETKETVATSWCPHCGHTVWYAPMVTLQRMGVYKYQEE